MNKTEIAEKLIAMGSDFHRRGWALGTSGNFSAVVETNPLRLAITASSVDKSCLNAHEILEVNDEGRMLNGSAGKPSAETLLHISVVKMTGAAAVLHTHSVWSTILSDYHRGQGGFYIEGYEMLKGLDGIGTHEHQEWLPILENSQDIEALARETETILKDQNRLHGFLIRRHGLYTWGRTLADAKRHVEILEFLLESVGRRRMMDPIG